MGGVTAVLESLPGDIDGIAAALLDFRCPYRTGVGTAAVAFRHARRSGGEGIVGKGIGALEVRESFARVLPASAFTVSAAAAHLVRTLVLERRVVVGDDLPPLGVPFPRGEDVCARILEHGDQERQHEGRAEHVLDRSVQTGTLPEPAVGSFVVVPAVALPESYVPAVESEREAACSLPRDEMPVVFPRIGYAAVVSGRFPVIARDRQHELGKLIAVGEYPSEPAGSGRIVPKVQDFGAEPPYVVFVPGVVGKFRGEI